MFRLACAIILAIAILTFGGAASSMACTGSDKVLLKTDFTFDDAAFDRTDNFAIINNSAVLKPAAEKGDTVLDNAFLFDNIDICVVITAVAVGQPDSSDGGLVFWAQDSDNYYAVTVETSGSFLVGHRLNGEWVHPDPVGWTGTDAIVQGLNKPNELEVLINGQSVTVLINGKTVTRLSAQAPDSPSLIGLYAELSNKVDTWKFNALRVTGVK